MSDLELRDEQRDDFYQTVWMIARMIPKGAVCTYGQIAGYIPCPQGIDPDDYKAYRARWVGSAMAASPGDVPWQRVINSQGKISIRDGAARQQALLKAEEIFFDEWQRIDLKKFGWNGPGSEWLREHHLVVPDEPEQLSFL